jgi:hypothetical protein
MRQLVLLALVAVVLVGEVWYLGPASATRLVVSFAFVGLILIVPFFIFRGRSSSEVQRIAAVWIVGGVVGAYVVGIFVLAAGIVVLLASAFRSGPRGPEGASTRLGAE